jgi:DNA-binding MarR family transcriptional regulator
MAGTHSPVRILALERAAVANSHSYTNGGRDQHAPGGGWNGLLFVALAFARELEAEMDRALSVVPLTARGFVVLYEIAREDAPSQRALAARLGLGTSTVSELLRRLARRGLVRLTPVPAVLTEAGQMRLRAAEQIAARLEREWARRLGLRRQALRHWLVACRAALQRRRGAPLTPQ